MTFYSTLSHYYSTIFPVSQAQKDAFTFLMPKTLKYGLDVGCATGQVTRALQMQGITMTGIDYNDEMIKQAQKLANTSLTFELMDMTQLHHAFKPQQCDVVLCLGNTLVHILPSQVKTLIHDFHSLLDHGGLLVLQIVNYDMIYHHAIQNLPLIDTETCSFTRTYHFLDHKKKILFKTSLFDKQSSMLYNDETYLYPLFYEQLTAMLNESFHIQQIFGSWKMEAYDPYHSPSLILTALKK